MENKYKHLPALTVVLIIALGALSFGTVRDMIGAAGGAYVGDVIEPSSNYSMPNAGDELINTGLPLDVSVSAGPVGTTADRCAFRSRVNELYSERVERDNHIITGCIEKVYADLGSCRAEMLQFDGRKIILSPPSALDLERSNSICTFFAQAVTTNSPISVGGQVSWEIVRPWVESADGEVEYTIDTGITAGYIEILKR